MSDDNQEIKIPLPKYIQEVAKVAGETAARRVIDEHVASCPIKTVQSDVKRIEIRLGRMLGYMVGTGLTGGGSVVAILKIFGG